MAARFSRRDINRHLAAGLTLLGSGAALAATPTPRQTSGPFYPVSRGADTDLDLTRIEGHTQVAGGEQILVRGRVLDLDGRPLADATVDIWQANEHGRYSHPDDPNPAPLDPHFQGQGIVATDADGHYGFRTIKPGAYSLKFLGGNGSRCRHIHFTVSRPGFRKLTTQMYFHGDPLIEQDLEIARVPREEWPRLIARAVTDAETGLPRYEFDLHLAAG